MSIEIDRTLIENPYRVHIAISDEQYQALRGVYLGDSDDFWTDSGSDAAVHEWDSDGLKIIVVCIDPAFNGSASNALEVSVHEAVHIWQKIKQYFNEDSPSDEFEAIAIAGLSSKIVVAFNQLIQGRNHVAE